MTSLFKSRKFWLMILDVVISTLTYFLTNLAEPALGQHILWLIAAWQPVFVAIITGIAIEDSASIKAGMK